MDPGEPYETRLEDREAAEVRGGTKLHVCAQRTLSAALLCNMYSVYCGVVDRSAAGTGSTYITAHPSPHHTTTPHSCKRSKGSTTSCCTRSPCATMKSRRCGRSQKRQASCSRRTRRPQRYALQCAVLLHDASFLLKITWDNLHSPNEVKPSSATHCTPPNAPFLHAPSWTAPTR